jgi:hypothetical protein
LICTTRSDRDEQKAGWWRNVTAKGQFCDFFDKAIAMLAQVANASTINASHEGRYGNR